MATTNQYYLLTYLAPNLSVQCIEPPMILPFVCRQTRTQGDIKGFIPPPPKLLCIVPQWDIFVTGIVGCDRLKLYLKIYEPQSRFNLPKGIRTIKMCV